MFFNYRDERGSLYAESGAGGPLRLLLTGTNQPDTFDGAVWSGGVVWAPDGKHYLYSILEGQLWSSDLGGTTRRLIARGTDLESPPTWSPDSRKIAFSAGDPSTAADQIWVAGANGGGAHPLTSGSDPRWSPDGRWIAFLNEAYPRNLMLVAANGGPPRVVAACVDNTPPSWSPNGRRIAYVSPGCKGTAAGLYVADRFGKHRRLIDRAVTGAPAWSPDGKWIAVASGGVGPPAAGDGVWVEHPDGSGRRPLSTLPPYDDSLPQPPSWAPDSRRLAVSLYNPGIYDMLPDIWVLNINGAGHQITDSRFGYPNYGPSWQPRNLPASRLGGEVVSPSLATDTQVQANVLQATRPITSIAADGTRVLIWYGTAGNLHGVDSLETWEPSSGSVLRLPSDSFEYQPPTLADDRLVQPIFEPAFGPVDGGYYLETATLDDPLGGYVQGICIPTLDDYDCGDADPLGDVVGQGSLIVFDSWKRQQTRCDQPCAGPKQQSRLFRIDGDTAVQIASSGGELTPLAVDNGRILVNEGSGSLAILDSTGKELSRIAAPGFSEATLQGSDVAVHLGTTLEDYDATTGVLLHAWSMPAGGVLEDVQDGIAAYVTNTDIHLVRLSDGRDAVITPPGTGPLHAQLVADGLYYSYTAADPNQPGRVAFVPFDQLP